MHQTLKTKSQKIAISSLFAALIFILTYFGIGGFWGGTGYIHFGDLFIYLSCVFVGGWWAVAASAVGSSLADLLLGQTVYVPITAIVKGLPMVFTVKLLGGDFKSKIRTLLAFLSGAAVMVLGYFAGEIIVFDWTVAFVNLPWNALQGIVGAVLAFTVIAVLGFRHRERNKE